MKYNKYVHPRVFNEGDLVLNCDQKHDKLGKGKFESMWYVPFIVSKVLEKGAYELVDYDGIPFGKPRNGLYLKRYYAYITHVWYLVYMYIFYFQCVLVFSIWF